ncbi:MAG: MFS transporter [Candidatus Kapaibacterium sp.]|jgi:MFS family permease
MRLKNDTYAVLRIRNFRNFSLYRLTLTIALQMQTVIIGWQVYALTKDPLSLGLVGLAEAIPALSIVLYAGHVADRKNRRNIILFSLITLFVCSLLFLYLSFRMTELYPATGIYPLYAVIFLSGLARGFTGPATFAMLSELVPRESLSNAAAWNSSVWQTGAIAGPALGGLLYGLVGLSNTFAISTTLMALSIVALLLIRDMRGVPFSTREPIVTSLLTGVRFVFKNQIVLGALSLDLFAVLFGGAVALLPIFASDILKVGPEGLGLLRAAPALGATVTGLWIAHKPLPESVGKRLFFAVGGFGICMIAFGLSTNFILSIVVLVVSGAFDSVSVVIRSTVLQLSTPDNMRGRVAAVNSMFIGSSNEIGEFESGVAAKLLGVVPSVIFGGCMTIVTVLGTAKLAPGLLRLKKQSLLGRNDAVRTTA